MVSYQRGHVYRVLYFTQQPQESSQSASVIPLSHTNTADDTAHWPQVQREFDHSFHTTGQMLDCCSSHSPHLFNEVLYTSLLLCCNINKRGLWISVFYNLRSTWQTCSAVWSSVTSFSTTWKVSSMWNKWKKDLLHSSNYDMFFASFCLLNQHMVQKWKLKERPAELVGIYIMFP